jgi:hypothetical protein
MSAPHLQDLLYNYLISMGSAGTPHNWKGGTAGPTTDIAGDGKILADGEQIQIKDLVVGGDSAGYLEVKMGAETFLKVYFDANDTQGMDFYSPIMIDGPGTVIANIVVDGGSGNCWGNVNVGKL